MARNSANSNLHRARRTENDEFYTRLVDIENEISMHPDYVRHFEGKTVLCNCDDPEWSNFHVFFRQHFNQLKMKKLICTHYTGDETPSYKLEWWGERCGDDVINMVTTPLKGNGDFRSDECIELLKEADIVVTNPPFSLFREYVAQLIEYDKKFIIIGNKNAITYREFFPLLKEEKAWLGYNSGHGTMWFATRIDGEADKSVPSYWYTNLDIDKRYEGLILNRNYNGNEERYPKYDNYDAINVNKVRDIPRDYFDVMGVPITYLANHSPEQFEILGMSASAGYNPKIVGIPFIGDRDARPLINGRNTYARVFIKRKQLNK